MISLFRVGGIKVRGSGLLWSGLSASFMYCAAGALSAAEVDIRADYSSQVGGAGTARFVNKTPISGYCRYQPAQCQEGRFDIMLPIRTSTFSIRANEPDPRKGAMMQVTNVWKDVLVTGPGGATERLSFRIDGFGVDYNFHPSHVRGLTGIYDLPSAHRAVWGGQDWSSLLPGCRTHGQPIFRESISYTFWKTTGELCAKPNVLDLPNFSYKDFNVSYELVTPNPLTMGSGTYRGSVTYIVGPRMDIDFGDLAIPNDPIMTFNFILQVNHILQISVPPGTESLQLAPPRGWEPWVGRSVGPDKLWALQNFDISSSGDFKVQLRCQHLMGSQCAIANGSGHQVPVDTQLTLPAGLTITGVPVNRQSLSARAPILVNSGRYVNNGRASLDFEVNREGVAEMLKHRGSTYSGDVTVVWDSNI